MKPKNERKEEGDERTMTKETFQERESERNYKLNEEG